MSGKYSSRNRFNFLSGQLFEKAVQERIKNEKEKVFQEGYNCALEDSANKIFLNGSGMNLRELAEMIRELRKGG